MSTRDVPISISAWASSACTCDGACTCGQDRIARARADVSRWFLRYRLDVCRFVVHCGCERVDAEDITQETFLRLFRTLVKGQRIEEDKALAWALTTARRLAIDRLRRRQVERRLFQALAPNLAETLPDVGQEFGDGKLEHERLLQRRRSAFLSALQNLGPLERQCIHLRAQGHPLRTIAPAVGLSMMGVSRLIRRVIKQLQPYLDELA